MAGWVRKARSKRATLSLPLAVMSSARIRAVDPALSRPQRSFSPALALGAFAVVAAVPLFGQALPVPFDDFRVPVHSAATDLGAEYGTWAGGNDYKASFHDGMTFVPRLGRDHPHNLPVSWRTVSVRRGERELLECGESPVPHGDDYRFEYRYAAFTEAYDVRTDGLEQTFVFTALPGTGDLVVTGHIDTELTTPDVGPAHQALVFCDDAGNELVRYGKAFAYDARGETTPGVARLAGRAGRAVVQVDGHACVSAPSVAVLTGQRRSG